MQLRPGSPTEAEMSPTRIAKIAGLAEKWVKQGLTPVLVVLVARHGVIVLHEAYGLLTPADDSPPLPRDAIFPMSSLSKPVTATAVMCLVEDGLLSLNRTVAEYIPEFRGEGKEAVLVHHLLTHTSGLSEEIINQQIDERKLAALPVPSPTANQHPQVNELLYYGYDAPLAKRPGIEMSYCSYGYDLLGEIVQRVSGKSLGDFANERIFAPLGMHDSWYSVPEAVRPRIVKRPPTALFAGPQSPGWQNLSVYPLRGPSLAWFDGIESRAWEELPSGAGGLYTTALDIARFGQMFLSRGTYGTERILSPATVAAMTRNQIPGVPGLYRDEFFSEASWGFGWNIHGDKKVIYHGTLHSPQSYSHGGAGGVRLWIDPVYDLVGVYFSVVLGNTADGQTIDSPMDLFMDAVTAAVNA